MHAGVPLTVLEYPGHPIYVVGPNVPTCQVIANDTNPPGKAYSESKWRAVPIPDPNNFRAGQTTDKACVLYQPSTHTCYEFWLMEKTGHKTTDSVGNLVDQWQSAWGGRMDNVHTNPGWWAPEYAPVSGWNFKPGMSASGISYLATTITMADLMAGEIRHPVGICTTGIWTGGPDWNSPPAQRTDGGEPNPA